MEHRSSIHNSCYSSGTGEKKKKKNGKNNRFADFKIADEAVEEVNEYFWLEIFTKK